jgi:hypothetical protein
MLGETVLQIVVAIAPGEVLPDPSAVVDPFFNVAAATAACGFVLAVCMMFSFRALIRGQLIGYSKTNMGLATQAKEAEELEAHRDKQKAAQVARKGGSPDQDDKQKMRKSNFSSKLIETKSFDVNFEGKAQAILLRMRLYNVLNAILWQAKSLAVMLVGVGVKLAMYNPMASPNAHFALAQRLELCIPLAVCFAIQLFHSLFVKTKHHYSWKRLAEQPMHVLVVLARISIIVGLPLLAFIRIEPLFRTRCLRSRKGASERRRSAGCLAMTCRTQIWQVCQQRSEPRGRALGILTINTQLLMPRWLRGSWMGEVAGMGPWLEG